MNSAPARSISFLRKRGALPSPGRDDNGSGGGDGRDVERSPAGGSTAGGVGGGGGAGESSIWVWLGPVFGSVATIAATLIGVYCVRKGKQGDESGDGSPGAVTGIAGGVHINVGGQGDHSQKFTAT